MLEFYLIILTACLILVLAGATFRWLEPSAPPARGEVELELVAVPTERPTRPRHPVVLVHGFMGFDTLGRGALRREYFHGVPARLRAIGADVHAVRLPALGGVRQRAERLAEQIRALPYERVNLVAHSMGGVDARYAISRLGLADRVASLVTIGTPHRGTPIADRMSKLFKWRVPGRDAIADLTTESMARFNLEVPDVPDVAYVCCIANAPRGGLRLAVEPGDGLVPLESQRWGDVLFEIDADHWAEIGWSPSFDALALYERIARTLAERGF